MKFILFISTVLWIGFMLIINPSFGQSIKVIDKDRLVESTSEYKILIENYSLIKDSLIQKKENWITDYTKRYQEIVKMIQCVITPEQVKVFEEELKQRQVFILAYDQYINDTLALFKTNLVDILNTRISNLLEGYAIANNINVVTNKSNWIYFDKNLDITDEVLEIYLSKFDKEEYTNEWSEIIKQKIEFYGIPDKLKLQFVVSNK